jgi:nitroimidazol reductase NimA-like FMN-containing flavoprotein (pyridoxamine 5'-phosphate oxidase superfamily)
MEKTEEVKRHIQELFASQNLAVLSTHRNGQPYASLIAFIASDNLRRIFFITPKSTRKFSNLSADPRVALLVNSSINDVSDFHQAVSVTVVGRAVEISGTQHAGILERYLARHPHLEEFAKSPTCALVEITARSYYLVKNFQRVMELHISQ